MEKKDYKVLPDDLQNYVPVNVVVDRLAKYGIYEGSMWHHTMYSRKYNRLYLFTEDGAWSSRAVDNSVAPKWIHTTKFTMLSCGKPTENVIIVEDLISALKVARALFQEVMFYDVMCAHGTGLSDDHVAHLLKYGKAILAYDGDDAGEQATRTSTRKLAPFLDVCVFKTPRGKDPKDLPRGTIIQLLEEAQCDH